MASSDKTLFLHIGQTKTGTSSLQAFLHVNRAVLQQRGVFYPEVPPDTFPRVQHRFLVTSLSRKGDAADAQSAWSYAIEQIRRQPAPVAVISAETFWNQQDKAIARVAQQLRGTGMDVYVRCYLRRQDLWIESLFNQRVKGHEGRDAGLLLDEFVQRYEQAGWLDYGNVLKPWVEHFGADRVRVRAFEKCQLLAGNVVDDFCDWIGISDLSGLTRTRERQSRLSWAACDLIGQLHRQFPDLGPEFKRPLVDALRDHAADGGDRRRCMSTGQARELALRYAETNRDVARHHAGRDELFEETVPVDAPVYEGLTTGQLAELFLRCYVDQQRQLLRLRQCLHSAGLGDVGHDGVALASAASPSGVH